MSEFAMRLQNLPPGERLLWQGLPEWWPLAVRAFHARKVAVYFAAFMGWRFVSGVYDGANVTESAVAALWLMVPAAASVGMLIGLAWVYARTTRYSITNRRVLLQFGVALPMTLNVPLRIVAAAALKTHTDGTGDIPLALTGKERAAYLLLRPYARPWRVARPEPMLRAVPDATRLAELLAKALRDQAESAMPPRADDAKTSADARPLVAAAA